MGTGQHGDIFFIPQRPYVVLGTLRDQLLYPTWAEASGSSLEENSTSRRAVMSVDTCTQLWDNCQMLSQLPVVPNHEAP